MVFLERGPLYLVAVSSAGEPEAALKLQLELLHAHLLAILTDSFDRTLARNPRFEPRRLLGAPSRFLSSPAVLCRVQLDPWFLGGRHARLQSGVFSVM